jgi:hypothetical protein
MGVPIHGNSSKILMNSIASGLSSLSYRITSFGVGFSASEAALSQNEAYKVSGSEQGSAAS